jgi:O-antigen ligase
MLPDSTKARLGTLLGDEETTPESRLIGSALSSSENRLLMLELSLKYTLNNPLFGVGPGQFREYADYQARKGGGVPLWRSKATHNSYTQVSSEAGLPAFLFYLGALVSCVRMNAKIYRHTRLFAERAHIAAMAWSLNLALLAYSVSTLFSSVAYHMYLPILAGLTVGLSRCVERHLGPTRPTVALRPESTEPAKLAAAA